MWCFIPAQYASRGKLLSDMEKTMDEVKEEMTLLEQTLNQEKNNSAKLQHQVMAQPHS